jgi:hypothetical protein
MRRHAMLWWTKKSAESLAAKEPRSNNEAFQVGKRNVFHVGLLTLSAPTSSTF